MQGDSSGLQTTADGQSDSSSSDTPASRRTIKQQQLRDAGKQTTFKPGGFYHTGPPHRGNIMGPGFLPLNGTDGPEFNMN